MIAMQPSTMQTLRAKYPRVRPLEIETIFGHAVYIIQGAVKPELLVPGCEPAELYGAAVLRVHAQLSKNVRERNAAWAGYWNLLIPYMRGQT